LRKSRANDTANEVPYWKRKEISLAEHQYISIYPE
jgi:hypothetical protein